MQSSLCITCCQPLTTAVPTSFRTLPGSNGSQGLNDILIVYFIAKKLLKFQDNKCLQIVEATGNIRNSELFRMCGSCEDIVNQAVMCHQKILTLERKIQVLGDNLSEIIRKSGPNPRDGDDKTFQEIRKLITTNSSVDNENVKLDIICHEGRDDDYNETVISDTKCSEGNEDHEKDPDDDPQNEAIPSPLTFSPKRRKTRTRNYSIWKSYVIKVGKQRDDMDEEMQKRSDFVERKRLEIQKKVSGYIQNVYERYRSTIKNEGSERSNQEQSDLKTSQEKVKLRPDKCLKQGRKFVKTKVSREGKYACGSTNRSLQPERLSEIKRKWRLAKLASMTEEEREAWNRHRIELKRRWKKNFTPEQREHFREVNRRWQRKHHQRCLRYSKISKAVRNERTQLEAQGIPKEEIEERLKKFRSAMEMVPLDQITLAKPHKKTKLRRKVEKGTQINCPLCGTSKPVGKQILAFSDHLESCAKSLAIQELECSLCMKWSCSSGNIRNFIAHIVMCRDKQTNFIPWRHSIIKCNLCMDASYIPYPEYAHHIFRYHQHQYNCTQCPFRAPKPDIIRKTHWNVFHKNLSDIPTSERYTKLQVGCKVPLPDIPWWCPGPQCLQQFPDEISRDMHLHGCQDPVGSSERNMDCSSCENKYFSEEELLLHLVTVHSQIKNGKDELKCPTCHKQFINRGGLTTHMKTHSISRGKKDHSACCEICGRVISKRYLLPSHLAVEHGIGDFICEVEGCSKVFVKSEELEDHRKYVHERLKRPEDVVGKSLYCQFCGRGFRDRHSVKRHETTKHLNKDNKPFLCHLCEKTFALEEYLKYHLKHTHKLTSNAASK